MKRFVTAIVLFAVTIASCVAETIFLDKTVASFSQDINLAMDETGNENLTYARQLTEDIASRWQEQQAFISTFINHDRLEEIGQSIISMKTNLEQGQIEDFFVESEVAKMQLNHLRDTESPSIQNIL